MIPVSEEFKEVIKGNDRKISLGVEIVGSETKFYTEEEIVDFSMISDIMPSDKFTIGNLIANQIKFKLRVPKTDVEDNSLINLYIGVETPEWVGNDNLLILGDITYISLGIYFVTDVSEVHKRVINITALDNTIVTHRDYESSLVYPATMRDVVTEITTETGLPLASDTLVKIPETYEVELMPTTETYHQILCWIAGACGGNFYMTSGGELALQIFTQSDSPVDNLELKHYYTLKGLGELVEIKAVRLYEKDEYTEGQYSETTIGSGTDRQTLEIKNPFISASIHSDLYNKFNGFSYIPAKIDYLGFPYLEVGDMIGLEKAFGMTWNDANTSWETADFEWSKEFDYLNIYIFEQRFKYKGGFRGELKSNAVSEQKNANVNSSSVESILRKLDKATIKENVPYNGVYTSRANGVEVLRSDGLAKAVLNATEGLSLYSDVGSGLTKNLYAGVDGKLYAKELQISGDSTFEGSVTITGGSGIGNLTDAGTLATLNEISETHITDDAITTPKIATGAIVASKIAVGSLSVISADLGSVTAGQITSNTSIDVSTDLTVGKKIIMRGSTVDGIYFENTNDPFGDFSITRTNIDNMRLFNAFNNIQLKTLSDSIFLDTLNMSLDVNPNTADIKFGSSVKFSTASYGGQLYDSWYYNGYEIATVNNVGTISRINADFGLSGGGSTSTVSLSVDTSEVCTVSDAKINIVGSSYGITIQKVGTSDSITIPWD